MSVTITKRTVNSQVPFSVQPAYQDQISLIVDDLTNHETRLDDIEDGAFTIATLSATDIDTDSLLVNNTATVDSLIIMSPTALKGKTEFVMDDNIGDTITSITIAPQAGARTYTLPDAGTDASIVMTEGAQTINGAKTFGSPILHPAGTAALPSVSFTGQADMGIYKISASELGLSASGTFIARGSLAKGFEANYINGTNFVKVQGAPVNSDTDPAPVSTTGMLGGLLTATPGGAIAYTLPTGTQMETAATWVGTGESFDFSLINLSAVGGATITMTAAADFTIVGNAVVAISSSAIFRARKTAANTFILYRIA